jgi:PKD repeat protein
MKKIIDLKLLFSGMLLLAATLFISSCSDDDDAPAAPTASFTYEADGKEVTFTSTSQNAKTYEWDFGDGGTSTEANPVHIYDAYGEYTVKLKVKGDGGETTSLPDVILLAKSCNCAIDGNVSDWDAKPDAITSVDGDGGTINKVKVDYDATKIYFYVEGTANLRGFFDIYLDADNDPATGYFSGWYPMGFGADFLSEGDFALVNDADLFKDQAGDVGAWGWDVASATGSGTIESSDLVTKGDGKAIEFSILRSALTNLSTEGFSFAVVDVDGTVDPDNTTATWAKLGSLPVDNTETSIMAFFGFED